GASSDGCASQGAEGRSAPVGSSAANAFGLYEVDGNAATWVEACYRENYLNAPVDGSASTTGNCPRLLRGGSWLATPDRVRAAAREAAEPKMGSPRRANTDGIRVARTIAP